jgi:hypothetical protein
MRTLPRLLGVAALASGLGGCATLHHWTHLTQIRPVEIRPILRASSTPGLREDGYYASAKTAIGRRDYGRALDLLQAARALKPDDVRVLNAFGVVYDKLGRFDLSARYYAEALALDPGSPVLANNMAWSVVLRGRSEPASPQVASTQLASLPAAAPQAAAPVAEASPDRPAVVRLGFAAQTPAGRPPPLLAGGPIRLEYASSHADAVAPVVQRIVRLGWSKPTLEARAGAVQPVTTIVYPARAEVLAKALARTLPRGVQLAACSADCDHMRLVLGADSTRWKVRTP